MSALSDVLAACVFPPAGTEVDLAVSGGADSVGLALLAVAAGLRPRLHHVHHHLRVDADDDEALVAALALDLGCAYVRHDVVLEAGGNVEARARSARRAVLPSRVLTGHTMDDLAETILINLLRGAGLDGLSPMVGDPTKPLLHVRRRDILAVVVEAGRPYAIDSTNDERRFVRNRIRHDVLPALDELADRDLVPILARQARLIRDEREWLDELGASDAARSLEDVDCRELRAWPTARLRRWLRVRLLSEDTGDGAHPPRAAEVERVMAVVRGDAVACEIAGARRVARRGQRLRIEKT